MARRSLHHINTLRDDPVEQDGSSQAVRNEFARRLEAQRIEKGWNQSELARRATALLPKPAKGQKQGHKIGRDMISHYSRGVSLPRPEALDAIARALGCRKEDLMPSGVPSTAEAPVMKVETVGPDRHWLRINRVVSTKTLSVIVELLGKEDSRDGPDD